MALLERVQNIMYAFSKYQQKHYVLIAILIILFTGLMTVGATRMTIESDFAKFDPEGLPITDLNKVVANQFSDEEGIVIIAELNPDSQLQTITDIRDPEVIAFLQRLENNILEEPFIEEAFSIASLFDETPETLADSKEILQRLPPNQNLISSDYSFTSMFITSAIGSGAEQITRASERIASVVEESSVPSDVMITVSGEPALGSILFNLLVSDAITVMWLSLVFIFILLVITEMSFKKAFMAIIPLIVGLIWTAGILGWFGIPITVATAGLSAMLLGLGVEYSVFLIERYKEERERHTVSESINLSVRNVGAAIFTSGGTTAIGFFALGLSIFPVLAGLGISLGVGILSLFSSTILIAPLVILIEDKLLKKALHQPVKRTEHEKNRVGKVTEKGFRTYGRWVSRLPFLFIVLALIISFFMFQGTGNIQQEEFNFDSVLPEDLPELNAFTQLENEFGDTSSARIYVYIDPEDFSRITDIRDPSLTEYVNQLTEQTKLVSHVESVESISEIINEATDGNRKLNFNEQRELLSGSVVEELITDDYSGTIIQITANEQAESDDVEFVRQLQEIVKNALPPPGVNAVVIGGLAVQQEQNSIVGPDSAKTSAIAFLVIIVFLFSLTGSVKKTVIPLVTVILGVLWTLGMIGLFRVPFTPITSSVITMTIGIGIDFGIQLITRFEYELQTFGKKVAMENSLTALLTPMIITVIAALIGFRSMNLGELKLMADLGTTMSIAVAGSMLATVTGVAALIVVVTRAKKHRNA